MLNIFFTLGVVSFVVSFKYFNVFPFTMTARQELTNRLTPRKMGVSLLVACLASCAPSDAYKKSVPPADRNAGITCQCDRGPLYDRGDWCYSVCKDVEGYPGGRYSWPR